MVLVGFLGTVVELFKKSHRISSNTRPGLPEVSKKIPKCIPSAEAPEKKTNHIRSIKESSSSVQDKAFNDKSELLFLYAA